VERNGVQPQVSEQQCSPLSVIAGATKYHKGVPCKLIENANQIAVFILAGNKNIALLKLFNCLIPLKSRRKDAINYRYGV